MRVREIQQPQLVMGSLGVLLLGALGTSVLYDSEEHKLIADRGASLVSQRSAVLPGLTRFEAMSAAQVIQPYREAKELAVGLSSYDSTGWDIYKFGLQDNAYYTGYGQSKYNLRIWVPSASEVSLRTLKVEGWTNRAHVFTFGELVSFYGDYRRTVHCDQGRCYLTNKDDPQYDEGRPVTYLYGPPGWIQFELANEYDYRPAARLTNDYLRYIGSGLVPPFGFLGGAVTETTYPGEELDAAWWGDEMMHMAFSNDWHFSSAAIAWYIGMHRLALLYVEKARTDDRYWNHALHYEAHALHSLTDLFAVGHLVVNRDRTADQIMIDQGVASETPYLWQKNVMEMGGGHRPADGEVRLTPALPSPIAEYVRPPRSDFLDLNIDVGDATLLIRADYERQKHDDFNLHGALVMNLKRQEFYIFGDHELNGRNGFAERIIAEAVRASLQSLFDAYESSASIEEIGGVGSRYFAALLNVPVYIKNDPRDFFDRQWTRYAKMVDAVVNAGVVPPNACEMPYVNGEAANPVPNPGNPGCDFAPPLSRALVVEELLSSNGALRWADREYLDAQGNQNSGYDVGDFLAWVRKTSATPSAVRP